MEAIQARVSATDQRHMNARVIKATHKHAERGAVLSHPLSMVLLVVVEVSRKDSNRMHVFKHK